MSSPWTFTIKPIAELLSAEMTDGIWVDPFAGRNSPATITNDLNPEFDTDFHMDAREFLRMFDAVSVDGVLLDPPYSPRQVKECYRRIGKDVTSEETKASFLATVKDETARVVKPRGKVITFGWNSVGIGKNRGFHITRIMLIVHGGNKNDTIVVVETNSGPGKEGQEHD